MSRHRPRRANQPIFDRPAKQSTTGAAWFTGLWSALSVLVFVFYMLKSILR